ncbi:MAG TPA: TonB-dependent receptor [Bryobacteraceae bacterium]|jgi:hypothetical protein
MRMRVVALALCLLFAGVLAFGQAGTGTITGIVADAQGAVVPGAAIEVKNSGTNQVYTGQSSSTGNFSITQLPPGVYELTAKTQGFKTYNHKNIQVEVAQTLRQDVLLEVGSSSESVTVTAEATLLRTESGDLATNITVESLDNLPILGIGTANAGAYGFRNPYTMLELLPGIGNYIAESTMVINGLGGVNAPTEGFRIEGQDFTNHLVPYAVEENQPSVDAIQEVSIQTSNYAPEFGTAGAAVLNITIKSGTNKYHGSAYDYFVNEDLNAGDPFSISGGCIATNCSTVGGGEGKYRPRNRRNDFGGTMGGPVYIPKIYNGHNKTFWFFNYEEYAESNAYSFPLTLPVPAYLNGNFAAISPNGNCSLCSTYGIPTGPLGTPTAAKDPEGRTLLANTIYDPSTRAVNPSSNLGYANPFPGNIIPPTRFDPVAMKLEALFPAATNANLTNNAVGAITGHRISEIPSFKIDESVTSKDKLSFYYSKTGTSAQIASPLGNADGLPPEIGEYRGTFIYVWIYRLNYDRTISPSLLLHLGAGYYWERFGDHAPFLDFNPSQFGLSGFEIDRQFPTVTGMSGAYGGMQTIGTAGQIQTNNRQNKPTLTSSLTKVSGSHTYKAGAEVYFQGTLEGSFAGVTLTTGTNATTQPYTNTTSLNGFGTGYGYASFLLGDYNSTTQTPELDYRLGKSQWDFFLQDSWKVTHKLTLDYGVRYDLATPVRETYGRLGQFDATLPNANAGGRPGATIYASTCGCQFYQPAYPYGIGPRLGVAYQLNSKTVLRGGWGVVYQFATDGSSGGIVSTTATNTVPGINTFINTQTPGFLLQPTWPVTNNNVFPAIGTTTGAPVMADANLNRPPRLNQWSLGVQREITRNLVGEVSYVGNRDVWLAGGLGYANQISPAQYAKYGLYPYPGTAPPGVAPGTYNNYADFQLLSQAINSTAVTQRMAAVGVGNGGLLLPYAGAPVSDSLSTALRAFPQFPGLAPTGSATGNERYDSLQAKMTKRISHGLQASGAFTWEKSFTRAGRQDFFNPESSAWALQNLPPRILTFNLTYTTPKAPFLEKVKFANTIIKDWQLGAFANYQSAPFLTPPTSPTTNFLASQEVRVPGQALYLKNINCLSCFNPETDQVLNPLAWQALPTNAVGMAGGNLIESFRGIRHPSENFNFGRNFRIKERMNLQFRGEFVNILNRTELPQPSTTAPQNAIVHNSIGALTSGYGVVSVYSNPNNNIITGRTGTVVMRFSF